MADVISSDEVMLEKGGPLFQSDWCPYEEGKFGYRRAHRESTMRGGRKRLR